MYTLAFGFSPPDMAIIAIVALVIFGPKKLPELGQQLGQAFREFRKISDEFTGAVHSVRDEVESVYKPVLLPPVVSHDTSSSTVEKAIIHGPVDQEPEELLPRVPEVAHAGSVPLTPDVHGKEI